MINENDRRVAAVIQRRFEAIDKRLTALENSDDTHEGGVKKVLVSCELLTSWLTKGHCFSDAVCTEGLPEGAKLISVKYVQDTLEFTFEHELFEGYQDVQEVQYERIV